MTRFAGLSVSLLEVLVACALSCFATTPNDYAACGLAALLGLVTFALWLED